RGVGRADFHVLALDYAIVDGVDEGLADLLANRRCRHRERAANAGQSQRALGEHAAAQYAFAVVDDRVDADRARAHGGRRVDALDASGELALAEAFDAEIHRLPDLHL